MFDVHEILFVKVTVGATTKNSDSEGDVNIWIMLLWIKKWRNTHTSQ